MILCGQETVRTFFAEARMVGVKCRKIRYPCATYLQPIISVSTASGNGVVSGKFEQKNVDTRRRAVG